MEFKVFDKVELIDNDCMSQIIGATGTIGSIDDRDYLYIIWDVPTKGLSGGWSAHRFKLVPDEPMKTCGTCDSFQEGYCLTFNYFTSSLAQACVDHVSKEKPMTCKCSECKNFEPKVDTAKVQEAWKKRKRLYAEGNKLYAKSRKLYAEGRKLYAEGDLHFCNAVLEVHGNVELLWDGDGCTVEGVTYKL